MNSKTSNPWQEHLETSTVHGDRAERTLEPALVPGLSVLWHPDVSRVGARVVLPALFSGHGVELSRLEPHFSQPGSFAQLPLADPHLSRKSLRLRPGDGAGTVRIERGSCPGEVQVDGQPLGDEFAVSTAAIERGMTLLLARRVLLLLHFLHPLADHDSTAPDLIGNSPAMARLQREIRQVGKLEVPVLLRGETGSGKELVARAIHNAGPRATQAYLAVNLAAVPPELATAELFGAARGSFTGAERKRIGYFARAQGGTLFLDEIGEIPPELQVVLLRVLENHEIQPVGAETPQKIDVRVVAATDADLESAIASGRFRAPLLHRLRGYEIRVPPLRERRDDLGRLLLHFLRQELAQAGRTDLLDDSGPHGQPWMPAELVARLAAYDWPGNVRELRNIARQLVVANHESPMARLGAGLEQQLQMTPRPDDDPPVSTAMTPEPAKTARRSYRSPAEVTEDELLRVLDKHRFRLQPAATELGVSRTSLYKLIEHCPKIRKASEIGRVEIERCLEEVGGNIDEAAAELRVSRHGLLLHMTELGLSVRR